MLANVKISGKLLLGFGAVLLILAMGSAFSILSANSVRREVTHVREVRYANAVDFIHLTNLAESALAGFRAAADSANLLPLEEAKKADAAFTLEMARIRNETKLDPNLRVQLDGFAERYRQCARLGEQTAALSVDQDFLALLPVKKEFTEATLSFTAASDELRRSASSALSRTLEEIEGLARSNVRFSLVLAVAGFFLGGGMAVLIARNITGPVAALVTVIEEFGRGNLSLRLHMRRGDEIGQVARAIDEMAERLQGLVTRVSGASSEIRGISGRISEAALQVDGSAALQATGVGEVSAAVSAIDASVEHVRQGIEGVGSSAGESTASLLEMSASIDQVAAVAEQLAQGVEGIAASISQMTSAVSQMSESAGLLKGSSDTTVSSIAQIDASINHVEGKARDMADISAAVRRDAEEGKVAVEATAAGMEEIKRATQISSAVIKTLAAKAADIGSILSVIDEITEQTSLLALNAAIIAAQAGAHGRGFAVVADEIRGLADRTAGSTREIGAVIRGVQEETAKAVQAIQHAEQRIDKGEALSKRSGELLGMIVAGAEGAYAAMDQIAHATGEQTKESRIIRSSIENVSAMIDQMARAVMEQRKGSELIRESAERMKDLTMQVKSSTREQTGASRIIAQSMEEISGRLEKIRVACEAQKEQSGQIVQAVGGIRSSAVAHLETTRVLQESARRLGKETDVLRQEMGVFRLAEPGCRSALRPHPQNQSIEIHRLAGEFAAVLDGQEGSALDAEGS